MADFHYREKLKQIEKAAANNNVPEGAKNIGLGCFIFVIILLIAFLIFLTVSLWMNDVIIGSLLTTIVVFICLFGLYKFWTAPKIP